MKIKKIGLRTTKTGIAVFITLLVCNALNITNPFFAAIAAIIAMESTLQATFTTSRDRMFGTLLGAFLAFALSVIMPLNAFTLGLGTLIVIYICNLFNWQGTIKIATIVFMAVLLSNDQTTRFTYALARIIDTFIGLSIGTLVNLFIFPREKNVLESVLSGKATQEQLIKETVERYLQDPSFGEQQLFDLLSSFEKDFSHYESEGIPVERLGLHLKLVVHPHITEEEKNNALEQVHTLAQQILEAY